MDEQIIEDSFIVNLNTAQNCFYNNGTFYSDVVFNAKNILNSDPSIHRAEVQILNAQFTASMYNINANNNQLNYSVGVSNFSVSLDLGNYYSLNLIDNLKNKFLINGHSFSITIDDKTGILTFTLNTNFTFNVNSSMANILGFKSTITSNFNVLTMTYPLNLLGISKIKIYSSNLGTKNIDTTGNCLATIPVNNVPYSLISYENYTGHANILNLTRISQIDLKITDEVGNLINFNGIDWGLTLRINVFRYVSYSKKTLTDVLTENA